MRRFSSEGSLLDLDCFPWKSAPQKDARCDEEEEEEEEPIRRSTYKTPPCQDDRVDHGAASLPTTPTALQDPKSRSAKDHAKEMSYSIEDLRDLDIPSGLLKVSNLNESFRAYSDSQLAPHSTSSDESAEKDDVLSPCSPSTSTLNSFCCNSGLGTHQNPHHVRSKLSSAKLHLKSLFWQVRGELNSRFFKPRYIYIGGVYQRHVLLPIEIFNEKARSDGGKGKNFLRQHEE